MSDVHEELRQEKLFYERFRALHGDRDLVRVYDRFGIGVFRRSCVLEGFDCFVRKHRFTGRRVVEIGTRNGLPSCLLARYFAEVVTIDIEPNAKKHEIAAFLGIENIRFVDIRNNREKAEVIRDLDFDAAFVDGDHARDTETDFSLVERCGRVLFDEYWAPQPSVVELVDALRRRGTVVTEKKLALWTR